MDAQYPQVGSCKVPFNRILVDGGYSDKGNKIISNFLLLLLLLHLPSFCNLVKNPWMWDKSSSLHFPGMIITQECGTVFITSLMKLTQTNYFLEVGGLCCWKFRVIEKLWSHIIKWKQGRLGALVGLYPLLSENNSIETQWLSCIEALQHSKIFNGHCYYHTLTKKIAAIIHSHL